MKIYIQFVIAYPCLFLRRLLMCNVLASQTMHSSAESALECSAVHRATRDGSSRNSGTSDSGTSVCRGNGLDLVSNCKVLERREEISLAIITLHIYFHY